MIAHTVGTISHTRRKRRGMTLVEVLAAMVIMGIVLPVVMHALTLSMQTAAWARHQTEAARLAESKLNELLVLGDVNALNGSGDFGMDWPEYRWDAAAAAINHGLYEVTVSVSWLERSRERSLEVATLIYPRGGGGLW